MKKSFCIASCFLIIFVFAFFIFAGCEDNAYYKCSHSDLAFIEDTATCEKSGVKKYKCKNCGIIIEEFSNQLTHDYSILIEDTATCVQSGEIIYECKNCGKRESAYQPAKGHEYFGMKCNNCGETDPEYETFVVNYNNNTTVFIMNNIIDPIHYGPSHNRINID